jgi:hypothetical protein
VEVEVEAKAEDGVVPKIKVVAAVTRAMVIMDIPPLPGHPKKMSSDATR